MADNTGQSFVDKHIEKVVLGVGVLILLVGVFKFMLSSDTVDLKQLRLSRRSEEVSYKELDDKIIKRAERDFRAIKNARAPKGKAIQNYARELENINEDPCKGVEKRGLLDYGIAKVTGIKPPTIEKPKYTIKPTSLDEMKSLTFAPGQPIAGITDAPMVRMVADGKNDNTKYDLVETPTLHAAVVFDLKKQYDNWLGRLRQTMIGEQELKAVFMPIGYEAQLQEKINGKWVDCPAPAFRVEYKNSSGQPITPPALGGKDLATVRKIISDQYAKAWSSALLVPTYSKFNKGRRADVSWMELVDIRPIANQLKKRLHSESTPKSDTGKSEENNLPSGNLPTTGQVPSLPKTQTPASEQAPEMENGKNIPELPNFEDQISVSQGGIGKIVAVVHYNNLKYGREYRVRFRIIMVNPLIGQPVKQRIIASKANDVKVPTITTPWSPWASAGKVERQDHFFITSASQQSKVIGVAVYKKILGNEVECKIANVVAGQKITAERPVKIYSPITGQPYKTADGKDPVVSFDTGITIAEINFDKELILPGGEKPQKVTEIVYVDAHGKTHRRIYQIDRASRVRKNLEAAAAKIRSDIKAKKSKFEGVAPVGPDNN